eukprot:420698_1
MRTYSVLLTLYSLFSATICTSYRYHQLIPMENISKLPRGNTEVDMSIGDRTQINITLPIHLTHNIWFSFMLFHYDKDKMYSYSILYHNNTLMEYALNDYCAYLYTMLNCLKQPKSIENYKLKYELGNTTVSITMQTHNMFLLISQSNNAIFGNVYVGTEHTYLNLFFIHLWGSVILDNISNISHNAGRRLLLTTSPTSDPTTSTPTTFNSTTATPTTSIPTTANPTPFTTIPTTIEPTEFPSSQPTDYPT